MKPKLITGLILAVLLIIILFQNTHDTILRIYFWEISLPQIILILLLLIIGFLGGFVTAKLMGKKKNIKKSQAQKII